MTRDHTRVDFSAYRFLVADDKPFVRQMVSRLLSGCNGRDVCFAGDGREAIKILTEGRGVDCAICDWNMAPVDGLTLLKLFRSGRVSRVPRDLKFIMMTGHAEAAVVKVALSLDVSGFLAKPVSMDNLIRAVESAMSKALVPRPAADYDAVDTVTPLKALKATAKGDTLSTMFPEFNVAKSNPDDENAE